MSTPDSDKRFEHLLASFLREESSAPRRDCPHPGLLSAYYEGKLSEPEARRLELHLSGCAGCQSEIAAVVRLEVEPTLGAGVEPTAAKGGAPATPRRDEPGPVLLERAAETAAGEPVPVAVTTKPVRPAKAAAEETPFKPRLRRSTWKWVAPMALAASAVLAISLTFRSRSLVELASRMAGEPELDRTAPVPAGRYGTDKDLGAKKQSAASAPQAEAPLTPTAIPNPPSAAMRDALSAESQSRSYQSFDHEKAMQVAPQPAERAEAKPATKEERQTRRADAAAPAVGGQLAIGGVAKQSKVGTEGAVVIVAETKHDVSWRLQGTTIERSDDSGKTWREQPAAGANGLLAGSAPSARVCWAVGRGGIVLRTVDGEHWQRLISPTSNDLTQVTAWSAVSAAVRTAGGERFATKDGGQTWSKR